MRLTDVSIRNAKPTDRPFKLFDGDGLFLLVSSSGSRGWRFKYRFDGKEKMLSFGRYPDVPLKAARDRRDEARSLVAAGTDPSAERKAKRGAREKEAPGPTAA
jgi:Arm DNA-binding domain